MAKASTASGKFGLWFWRLFKLGLLLAILGLIIVAVFVAIARNEIDSFSDLKKSPNGQMITVRAADGTVIQRLGPSFGRWLPLDKLPSEMKDAMVAVEDRRFRYHPGVDPIGVARAFYVRFKEGRWTEGGSTITQQLVRNVYLNNNKEIGRKLREMVLAMAMETRLTKDQILELYLNKVYFGGGAFGVDSASRRFFDHGAEELTLAESAVIAGLVKAPSRYSPTADAQAALGRASVVVEVMQDAGMITAAEAAQVRPAEVKLSIQPRQDSVRYFTDWALPQLDVLIDEREKPINIYTTLDLGMQRAAVAAIQTHAPRGAQGALVSLDRDGAVRAMVGGTDYATSNYNRAVTAVRQPGSAFKLFVYLTALEAGFRPDDRVDDEPIEIDGWQPRNSGGRYAGEISLRTAFTYSKNTVAARIGNELGTSTIASMARRFGITTPVNTSPSMVLGTSEARVIEMTRAFAQVAAGGKSLMPYGITKVTTIDGDVIYRAKPPKRLQLVQPYVAAGMTDLMQSAVSAGTGRAAQIGRPVAGKTGTTSSNKDGWFLGFSSGLTTGVWIGRDDARPIGGLEGGRAPARAFASFMKIATAQRPIVKFATDVTFPERLDGELSLTEEEELLSDELLLDENGMPIEGEPDIEGGIGPAIEPETLDQDWLDRALGRQPKDRPPSATQPKVRPQLPDDVAPPKNKGASPPGDGGIY